MAKDPLLTEAILIDTRFDDGCLGNGLDRGDFDGGDDQLPTEQELFHLTFPDSSDSYLNDNREAELLLSELSITENEDSKLEHNVPPIDRTPRGRIRNYVKDCESPSSCQGCSNMRLHSLFPGALPDYESTTCGFDEQTIPNAFNRINLASDDLLNNEITDAAISDASDYPSTATSPRHASPDISFGDTPVYDNDEWHLEKQFSPSDSFTTNCYDVPFSGNVTKKLTPSVSRKVAASYSPADVEGDGGVRSGPLVADTSRHIQQRYRHHGGDMHPDIARQSGRRGAAFQRTSRKPLRYRSLEMTHHAKPSQFKYIHRVDEDHMNRGGAAPVSTPANLCYNLESPWELPGKANKAYNRTAVDSFTVGCRHPEVSCSANNSDPYRFTEDYALPTGPLPISRIRFGEYCSFETDAVQPFYGASRVPGDRRLCLNSRIGSCASYCQQDSREQTMPEYTYHWSSSTNSSSRTSSPQIGQGMYGRRAKANFSRGLLPSSRPNAKHGHGMKTNSQTGASMGTGKRRHLLHFIVEQLFREHSCVEWVDKADNVFHISNPDQLTRLWGQYKNNRNMTFDSLARSLRLYYAPGKLERIQGRRHHYRILSSLPSGVRREGCNSITSGERTCKSSSDYARSDGGYGFSNCDTQPSIENHHSGDYCSASDIG